MIYVVKAHEAAQGHVISSTIRWTTNLCSNFTFPHAINCKALGRTNFVALPTECWGNDTLDVHRVGTSLMRDLTYIGPYRRPMPGAIWLQETLWDVARFFFVPSKPATVD